MLRFVLVALALLLPGGAVTAAPAMARVGDPFTASTRLYVDPSEPAAQQARAWRTSRPADAALMDRIATRPVATWLGDWNPDVRKDAAALATRVRRAGAIPVVVAYDIPQRDCGSYSAGGALRSRLPRVDRRARAGLGAARRRDPSRTPSRAGTAWMRPARPPCPPAARSHHHPGASAPGRLPRRRQLAPAVARGDGAAAAQGRVCARGIAVNVSNFRTTEESLATCALRRLLPHLHAVIDTSRNGRGPAPGDQW